MKRPFPAAMAAVALALLASACAIPHPRTPVPKIPTLPQTSLMYDRTGGLIKELHAGEHRPIVPLSAGGPLLAGLIQTPSSSGPVFHTTDARSRRDIVLARMRYLGMIDTASDRQGEAAPLGLNVTDRPGPYPAPYFVDFVERWFLGNP